MGIPAIGTVVWVNFPFADLKGYKKRPALVVAHSSLDTVILCQITSKSVETAPQVIITDQDFATGSLAVTSYARPDKLLTVDGPMAAQRQLGVLNKKLIQTIRAEINGLFR